MKLNTIALQLMGKIQGDGQKFLDNMKSYFGSQISSQSLNEVHIYWLQPKSATKSEEKKNQIFLSLIVLSPRMLPFDIWPSFPVITWTLPKCQCWQGNCTHDSTFSDCIIFFSIHFTWDFNCHTLFTRLLTLQHFVGFVHCLQSVMLTWNNQRWKM